MMRQFANKTGVADGRVKDLHMHLLDTQTHSHSHTLTLTKQDIVDARGAEMKYSLSRSAERFNVLDFCRMPMPSPETR